MTGRVSSWAPKHTGCPGGLCIYFASTGDGPRDRVTQASGEKGEAAEGASLKLKILKALKTLKLKLQRKR